MSVCIELRRQLANTPVTLNGEPAVVCGVQRGIATVRYLGGDQSGFYFAWETVLHVIAHRGGAFRS